MTACPWARITLPIVASLLMAVVAVAAVACGGDSALTVYSGRSENLVQPIIDRFSDETGIKVQVRYGETAELAATILEEGANSPADIFFAQDASALGALTIENRLTELPADLLQRVPEAFRSPDDLWIGLSGRARVIAYNTDNVSPEELPDSILDFTHPEWKGRIGWPPTNGSFQAFVTALRLTEGEDGARAWLEGIKANGAKEYPNNVTALEAVANGEIDIAFVNHYYLFRFLAEEGEGFSARNYYPKGGDPGALVNIAGAGILNSSDKPEQARQFIDFMLSQEAQQYFADETFEYPLIEGVETHPELVPLADLEPPPIDLSDLADLKATLELLRDTGVLP